MMPMKKVLFVCVENARRSQMAEAFLNELAGGQAVAGSAGNRPALRVDPKAVEVMKELRIDITKQRPKPLTMKMVKDADVVITMGCGADVCPIVPKAAEEWRIEDPAGRPTAKFREVRDEIHRRVEKLVESFRDDDNP